MHDSPESIVVPDKALNGDEAEKAKREAEEVEEKKRKEAEELAQRQKAEEEERERKEKEAAAAASSSSSSKKDKKKGKKGAPSLSLCFRASPRRPRLTHSSSRIAAVSAAPPAEEKKKAEEPVEEEPPAGPNHYVDSDPLGVEHLTSKAPLDEALKFVKALERVRPHSAETWRLKAEVEMRRGVCCLTASSGRRSEEAHDARTPAGKWHSAVQAIRTSRAIEDSPALLPLAVRLEKAVGGGPEHMAVSRALDTGLAKLDIIPEVELPLAVDQALQQHSSDAEWVLAAAEAKAILGDDNSSQLMQLVQNESLKPTLKVWTLGPNCALFCAR